jgi:hypothetical protein
MDVFFENNCGAKPPSNEYINQKGETATYKRASMRQKREKKAPNQQLGLGTGLPRKDNKEKKRQDTGILKTKWPQVNLKCTDAESF